jgi:hypothetical protein
MSIPKAGSRLLHLDGSVYRWRVRSRPTYSQANGWNGLFLAVEDAAHPKGSVLVVSLGVAHPSNWLKLSSRAITPAEVSGWVRRALSLGWQPRAPGVQFFLSASSTDGEPSLESLWVAVELACQPQNASPILRGREMILAMPRRWVLEHVASVATAALDLSDYWEYRRLLELLDLLDPELLQRFVLPGLSSADPNIREAAEDFHR